MSQPEPKPRSMWAVLRGDEGYFTIPVVAVPAEDGGWLVLEGMLRLSQTEGGHDYVKAEDQFRPVYVRRLWPTEAEAEANIKERLH